jgi:hypothetical protein
LNSEARADISTWQIFIQTFNGKSVFLKDHWQNSESLNLYTDASGNVGFAAVLVFSGLSGTPKREHREEKHRKSTNHLSEFGGPTNKKSSIM